jgi:hypothetical protein
MFSIQMFIFVYFMSEIIFLAFVSNAQISDEFKDFFSKLSEIHILDIGIVVPYAQIVYGYRCDVSELPDIHTLGIGIFCPCAQIYDA